ncbi:MAG: nucleotidyltransferase domain-containing protein [candidate division KSB1 bacterium]|nr:nucleotidyltransferase domain-containing protein [candidate division KSB1 bacterium]MDZ7401337.1 nucleotidyltransferase domain-containing protein [candidate division KSB1 bacterium]
MPKIPKNPEQIFSELVHDYQSLFGDQLIAIILYGSAARGEYVYKRSDINFLIVLSESGIRNLRRALPLVARWKKRNVSTPLILTQEYIHSALDAFPIEFLTIKLHHHLVYGIDILASIEINLEHLRLQCERELRGKLLYLREGFLNSNGRPTLIKQLISQSLPAFASIFTGLLYLKNIDVPSSRRDLFSRVVENFDLDAKLFEHLIEQNYRKFGRFELCDLMDAYIIQIAKLINVVDQL